MREAPHTAVSQANAQSVALAIGRCAESLLDVDRLRGEVNILKSMQGGLAGFSAALFELECAKRGDADARTNMLDTADQLLQFWRDRSGDTLAAAHPTLSQLWSDASALLVSFEKKRIDRALKACWDARTDSTMLTQAIADLSPAGDRRVEFATCLYHLELARLFVDSSRVEFARRIELVREAYLEPSIAQELMGGDPGLQALWKDLVPYLDEFFEAQEQEEEAAARKKSEGTDPGVRPLSEPLFSSSPALLVAPPPNVPVTPGFATLMPGQEAAPPPPAADIVPADEVEIIESRELAAPLPAVTAPAPPPFAQLARPAPPQAGVPPPLPKTPSLDSEVEIIELEEAPPPLPVSKRPIGRELDVLVDYEPGPSAQAFWRHTEATLQLLPDPNVARTGTRVLSADSRGERKKLNGWLDGLTGRFQDVPEARAMQCLMRLYMAAQIKEKTLFGQPNPKRKEAFRSALQLLSEDAAAAGRAALWFELDGPGSTEHLQVGLDVVMDFLQFCARQKLDPLDGAAADRFMRL